MPSITKKTAEIALGWTAQGYRQTLNQRGVPTYSAIGVIQNDLERPGTWIETHADAVAELWKITGGPKVDQYVLAQTVHDADGAMRSATYRRFRITGFEEEHHIAVGTEAWSGASERTEHRIALDSAFYVG